MHSGDLANKLQQLETIAEESRKDKQFLLDIAARLTELEEKFSLLKKEASPEAKGF